VEFRLGESVSPESLRGIRALVHCAYDFSLRRRDDIARVNVDGSDRLFRAAHEAGIGTVVCISSISAFDGCQSRYGMAKLAIEGHARACGAFVIRPGLIFGDPPGGMYGRLVGQVARSTIVPLIGDGSQVQFLVHQDDLAALIARCCAGAVPIVAVPITVAHRRAWPMRELLGQIARRLGRTPVFIPTPPRVVWAALKVTEALGLRLAFRSDSVVSLLNQDPAPDFTVAERLGVVCRPFP
jgi:nucleoside-diphosphate-sugar epimerase